MKYLIRKPEANVEREIVQELRAKGEEGIDTGSPTGFCEERMVVSR